MQKATTYWSGVDRASRFRPRLVAQERFLSLNRSRPGSSETRWCTHSCFVIIPGQDPFQAVKKYIRLIMDRINSKQLIPANDLSFSRNMFLSIVPNKANKH